MTSWIILERRLHLTFSANNLSARAYVQSAKHWLRLRSASATRSLSEAEGSSEQGSLKCPICTSCCAPTAVTTPAAPGICRSVSGSTKTARAPITPASICQFRRQELLEPATPLCARRQDLLEPATPLCARRQDLLEPVTPLCARRQEMFEPVTPLCARRQELLEPDTQPRRRRQEMLALVTQAGAGRQELIEPVTQLGRRLHELQRRDRPLCGSDAQLDKPAR
jgi:hypothetical protein